MDTVKSRRGLLFQWAIDDAFTHHQNGVTKRLLGEQRLRLNAHGLRWQNVRRSRTVDRGIGLGRLNQAALDINGVRCSREIIASLTVRHHGRSPAGAADDFLRFDGCGIESVVHHLRQLRRSECANDGTASDEQRDHVEPTICESRGEMQFHQQPT